MGSLEALTKKIIEDGSTQAQRIIDEALEKSKKELEEAIRETERICANRIKEAEGKANELYQLICAEKEIELRDKNLFIKQKMIDQVFKEAFKQLQNLKIEDYKELLIRMLGNRDLSNNILILPEKYAGAEQELNVNPPLKTEYRPLAGGFILMREGVEENYTFESWIDLIRQEMEQEVMDILYGEER
ncbi:V-type ATP synthase subunit E [Lacrimispora sp.]|uniref:V-type ATP synthase subunit E n=1 Tax=Lacrimispora sp. TaxID=2719234 RepID=UPI003994621B